MRALLLLLVACKQDADPHAQPVVPEQKSFGLYVLAESWAPSFCCKKPDRGECQGLATAFGGTHLTLHGLWPNYTDDEARGKRKPYPEDCGPDESAPVPKEMSELAPGYAFDHLGDHEYKTHGSCTGMTKAAYFATEVAAMKAIPTPAKLTAAVGATIALAELEASFNVPATSVLLSCDAHCQLEQVSFCLATDAKTPVPCPTNVTKARYDNGCVTRHCDQVAVPAVGSCGVSDTRETFPAPADDPREPGKCNHPNQGPACSGDADCTSAGYQRCARSGCCTNQPR